VPLNKWTHLESEDRVLVAVLLQKRKLYPLKAAEPHEAEKTSLMIAPYCRSKAPLLPGSNARRGIAGVTRDSRALEELYIVE
jgi:hypothetical protein